MQRCRQYHWEYTIVLKDKDLPSVWEEFHALDALQPNRLHRNWGERRQCFRWVNAIDYAFSQGGRPHNPRRDRCVCPSRPQQAHQRGAAVPAPADVGGGGGVMLQG